MCVWIKEEKRREKPSNNNECYGKLYLWGPKKWRIDESLRFKHFRQKNDILYRNSLWHIDVCAHNRWRTERESRRKNLLNKCVVYDERSPEGTEVQNKCHKRNDIQFILPIVCFFIFLIARLLSFTFSLSPGCRDLNTENFLNCGHKSGPNRMQERIINGQPKWKNKRER